MKKLNVKLIEELVKNGYTDSQIADILKCNKDSISRLRSTEKFGINTEKRLNNDILISEKIFSILIGTLLGDSSLRVSENSIYPSFSCEHGFKQKEYCQYKFKLLYELNPTFSYYKRKTVDIRTNKLYESYVIRTKSNSNYKIIYDNMYINNKKRITDFLLTYYTEQSLALHFMDDGSKSQRSYTLATNCFPLEDLLKFKNFLYYKWNIETTIFSSNVMYI